MSVEIPYNYTKYLFSPISQKMNFIAKECFIIGSGRSLLNLSEAEKNYLNSHPNTLAMNKYLLFYEKIGIIPKALFLGDFHFPAHKVFLETIQNASQLNTKPTYYVDQYYKKLFSQPLKYLGWNLENRYQLYTKYNYLPPLYVNYPNLAFFKAEGRSGREFIWGKSLDEQLFFQRGSLSTALNLAYIIYPDCDIKLIGIDLSYPESFYEEELKARTDLIDTYYYERARKAEKHDTVVETKEGTVLDRFPLIQQELAQRGNKLLCCNPNSLVVTQGLCDYVPIMN
ncbi:MAG TPA: hypothetical protein DCF68_04855 [Cyanothece sp. UBA12306]|nr:hypothetical protein [Cyanothece sp. UBA12306]